MGRTSGAAVGIMDTELNWTTQTPTVSGWYWYRGGPLDRLTALFVDDHLQVGANEFDISEEGTSKRYYAYALSGKWAGPLELPGG